MGRSREAAERGSARAPGARARASPSHSVAWRRGMRRAARATPLLEQHPCARDMIYILVWNGWISSAQSARLESARASGRGRRAVAGTVSGSIYGVQSKIATIL